MITQENQTGKKPEEFNLAIFKVKLNPLWKIEVYTIATSTTNILLLPWVENLLSRPRDSFESTDYFFLGFLASTSTPACVSLNS